MPWCPRIGQTDSPSSLLREGPAALGRGPAFGIAVASEPPPPVVAQSETVVLLGQRTVDQRGGWRSRRGGDRTGDGIVSQDGWGTGLHGDQGVLGGAMVEPSQAGVLGWKQKET